MFSEKKSPVKSNRRGWQIWITRLIDIKEILVGSNFLLEKKSLVWSNPEVVAGWEEIFCGQ